MRRSAEPSAPAPGDSGGAISRSTFDRAAVGRALLPAPVRRRAVDVSVTTDARTYALDDPVRFRVRFRNRLPVPVTVPVAEAVPWSWSVAGVERASQTGDAVPAERGRFEFARGETKTFARVWRQRIRVASDEWTRVDPGEYAIGAWIATDDEPGGRLSAETTVRIGSPDGQTQ